MTFETPDCTVSNVWAGPVVELPPQEVLVRQGEPVDELFLVVDGLAKLGHVASTGKMVTVGLSTWGPVPSLYYLLAAKPSPVTVTTLTPCRAHHFTRTSVCGANGSSLVTGLALVETEGYRCLLQRVIDLLVLTPLQRLRKALHGVLADVPKLKADRQAVRVQLPFRFSELASLVAVTPEHLSRLLRLLQLEGVLRREKGWLIIDEGMCLYEEEPEASIHCS